MLCRTAKASADQFSARQRVLSESAEVAGAGANRRGLAIAEPPSIIFRQTSDVEAVLYKCLFGPYFSYRQKACQRDG
jgi:hypothetical protein